MAIDDKTTKTYLNHWKPFLELMFGEKTNYNTVFKNLNDINKMLYRCFVMPKTHFKDEKEMSKRQMRYQLNNAFSHPGYKDIYHTEFSYQDNKLISDLKYFAINAADATGDIIFNRDQVSPKVGTIIQSKDDKNKIGLP